MMPADEAQEHGSSDAAALDPLAVSPRFLDLITHDHAREHLAVSQGEDGPSERLVVAATTPPAVIHNIGVRLDRDIQSTVAEPEEIARTIDDAYAARAERGEAAAQEPSLPEAADLERMLAELDRDLLSTEGKGAVVKFVDSILFEALGRSASDVHIQPLGGEALIRLRVDGILHTIRSVAPQLADAMVSRIKVMGRMDIAERRVAQDGRTTITIGDRSVDIRISTFPTVYGERAVLRLLDNSRQIYDLEALGMPADVESTFLSQAKRSHGIILVTGPTGSGKTTTLYSTLRRIAFGDLNVMTIEDPVEYDLTAVGLSISQAQVNLRKGVDFATGLRHILRQDPDVILVGEIRDAETARMAIQSSLTGHLVLSTLHTNDAPSAVARLIDLGVEPYLVSASLSAVLAQRLVRTVHQACEGHGCETCFGTGLLGRTGLYELMGIDDGMRALVQQGAQVSELHAAAVGAGMVTLREQGARLIGRGITTEAEVDRVVQGA
jgi:general secretion pathway protein E